MGSGIDHVERDSQPFPDDHNEKHRRKEASEQEAGLAREVSGRRLRSAGRSRFRHGVAGAFHRAADRGQINPGRIEAHNRLLGGQEDIDRCHARQVGNCVADVLGALGAIHAGDRDFQGGEFGVRRIIAWGNCRGM